MFTHARLRSAGLFPVLRLRFSVTVLHARFTFGYATVYLRFTHVTRILRSRFCLRPGTLCCHIYTFDSVVYFILRVWFQLIRFTSVCYPAVYRTGCVIPIYGCRYRWLFTQFDCTVLTARLIFYRSRACVLPVTRYRYLRLLHTFAFSGLRAPHPRLLVTVD